MSKNSPEVLLRLTQEQADFLEKNCETNISVSLTALNAFKDTDPDFHSKLTNLIFHSKMTNIIDGFIGIRSAIKKAREDV